MSHATHSSSSLSPVEQLLIAVLAGAAAIGAVVWGGAALSSAVSGRGPLSAGLGDALRAIPRLAASPGRPSEAWPEATRDQVASTPLYWVSTAVVLAAVVGTVVVGRRLWRRLTPSRRRLGVDAHARVATRRELRPLLVRKPVPGRFVFGAWGRWLLATENRRWAPATESRLGRLASRLRGGEHGDITSLAICGPTRCGKTSHCAVPGLLDWAGPAFVLSVKRDLMDTTIERRRQLGEVRVFDPGGFLAASSSHIAVDPSEVAKWSPLRTAHTASGAKKAGETLSSWTPKTGVEGGMDFWAT